jgi:hypothetical protein
MNLPHQYISISEIATLLEAQLIETIQNILQERLTFIDKNVAHEIAKEASRQLETNLTTVLQDVISKKIKILTSKRSGW